MSQPGEEVIPAGTEVILATGITYRQADYWTRLGYLRPVVVRGGGSGRPRGWPPAEVAVAARMKRLTDAGISPERAHRFARDLWPCGEIAPGITVAAGEERSGAEAAGTAGTARGDARMTAVSASAAIAATLGIGFAGIILAAAALSGWWLLGKVRSRRKRGAA